MRSQLSPLRRARLSSRPEERVEEVAEIAGIIGLALTAFSACSRFIALLIDADPAQLLGDGRSNVGTCDSGYVSTWARGSSTKSDTVAAQRSEIRCYRDQRECYQAQASIFSGYLTPALERYPISRWDASSIEFSNNLPCVIYTYVIDPATQKLSGRRLKKKLLPVNAA